MGLLAGDGSVGKPHLRKRGPFCYVNSPERDMGNLRDEVGGQPLGNKGIQPPPPEPDRHVFVHPALQTQDLRLFFRSASSLSRAE